MAHFSPLLQLPKPSPSSSNGLPGTQTYDTLDLDAADAAHKAEGERLHLARTSRDLAAKVAKEKVAEQLAAHIARQEQLRQELLAIELAEEAAAKEYAQ